MPELSHEWIAATERRIHQLTATNGALMNEIDRLRLEIALLKGWTPPPEPDPQYWIRSDDGGIDWCEVEIRKMGGDRPWRLVTDKGWEIHELRPYPDSSRPDLPPFWAPMAYARKAEAAAAIVTMRHRAERGDIPEGAHR